MNPYQAAAAALTPHAPPAWLLLVLPPSLAAWLHHDQRRLRRRFSTFLDEAAERLGLVPDRLPERNARPEQGPGRAA